MVLKSGANQYHGSLWFSHLSRPLMTHPFFVNRNFYDLSTGPPNHEKDGRLWPATKTNRYRGQIGGPVMIPKLYNGRNRTFFSYGNDFILRISPNFSPRNPSPPGPGGRAPSLLCSASPRSPRFTTPPPSLRPRTVASRARRWPAISCRPAASIR